MLWNVCFSIPLKKNSFTPVARSIGKSFPSIRKNINWCEASWYDKINCHPHAADTSFTIHVWKSLFCRYLSHFSPSLDDCRQICLPRDDNSFWSKGCKTINKIDILWNRKDQRKISKIYLSKADVVASILDVVATNWLVISVAIEAASLSAWLLRLSGATLAAQLIRSIVTNKWKITVNCLEHIIASRCRRARLLLFFQLIYCGGALMSANLLYCCFPRWRGPSAQAKLFHAKVNFWIMTVCCPMGPRVIGRGVSSERWKSQMIILCKWWTTKKTFCVCFSVLCPLWLLLSRHVGLTPLFLSILMKIICKQFFDVLFLGKLLFIVGSDG